MELHLPYIKKIFGDAGKEFQLLPMMVGQVKNADVPKYASKLKHLFVDPRSLFVISSDFCHWGVHFDYQPVLQKYKSEG